MINVRWLPVPHFARKPDTNTMTDVTLGTIIWSKPTPKIHWKNLIIKSRKTLRTQRGAFEAQGVYPDAYNVQTGLPTLRVWSPTYLKHTLPCTKPQSPRQRFHYTTELEINARLLWHYLTRDVYIVFQITPAYRYGEEKSLCFAWRIQLMAL